MTTATDTALARVEQSSSAPANFGAFLELVKPRLAEVLPSHINAETLIRVVQSFGSQNAKLLKCTEASLLTSLMMCSQLGLPPNTPQGFAWLIPFWNGRQKVMECKVMFGKNGLAQLVRNTGEVLRMNSGVVYEHEVLSGTFTHTNEPPTIAHRSDVLAAPELYADEHLVAAYALIETKAGGRVQRVLRRDEVLKRRDASQAVQRAKQEGYLTPWDNWEAPMWTKTAIRAMCGMPEVPKSTDLITALASDVDAPDFDELQNITVTQVDGFRQQAAAAMPTVIDAPALPAPAPEQEKAPEPADTGAATAKKEAPKDTGPKMGTKAMVARLWKRWAKITDCDPKDAADVDKNSFKEFVGVRIGEEKAGDSSTWTAEECKTIGKGLDELRDGGAPAPSEKQPPAADGPPTEPPGGEPPPTEELPVEVGAENGTPAATGEPAEPAITQQDALKKLKDLRTKLNMPWDEVRAFAAGECGVESASSARWSVEELIDVAACMEASRDQAESPTTTDPQPPARPADPEPEPGSDEDEPPPLDESAPETEADTGEQEIRVGRS